MKSLLYQSSVAGVAGDNETLQHSSELTQHSNTAVSRCQCRDSPLVSAVDSGLGLGLSECIP